MPHRVGCVFPGGLDAVPEEMEIGGVRHLHLGWNIRATPFDANGEREQSMRKCEQAIVDTWESTPNEHGPTRKIEQKNETSPAETDRLRHERGASTDATGEWYEVTLSLNVSG